LGPQLFVQFDGGAVLDHDLAHASVFFVGAVAPVNRFGLAQGGLFFYPLQQLLVGSGGRSLFCPRFIIHRVTSFRVLASMLFRLTFLRYSL
jgi:hypothetical protein